MFDDWAQHELLIYEVVPGQQMRDRRQLRTVPMFPIINACCKNERAKDVPCGIVIQFEQWNSQ